jgi:tetratricopeptide (TPR) repeat protein
VGKLLRDAQLAYIQRRFSEAAEIAGQAIALDPASGRAYVILGDIMRVKGKLGEAVKAYSYALQYDPTDKETEKKLMDIVSKHVVKTSKAVAESEASFKVHVAINIAIVGAALLLLFLIRLYPGAPISSLKTYMPPASFWSANLAGFIAASSLLIGVALSANGLVANPDEEILFEGGNNWAVVPTGIGLLFGSGFFFLGAAAFYLLVGFLQGSVSKSVVTVFACVTAVVLIAAIMYNIDPAIKQVLLFGGNVSFLPMLIGWYIGAAFRPLNE